MIVSDVVVESILAAATLVCAGGFSYLNRRSTDNAKAISSLEDTIETKLEGIKDDFNESLKDVLSSIVLEKTCDANQLLWETKFAAMMEANRLQHLQIVEKMTATNKAVVTKIESYYGISEKQLVDLFSKIEDIEKCMKLMQLKRDCD